MISRQFLMACALAGLGSGAMAESIGEVEYMNSCATCHGADGTGGGPMSGFLTATTPDLTRLAERNGGIFPVTAVYMTIEGTEAPSAHGTSEMPVWGDRYRRMGARFANPDYQEEEAAVFARFRILALIEYLESLQQ